MEYCSFFSMNFGYISDYLQDANISSICLFGVEEWSTGVEATSPYSFNIPNTDFE